MECVQDFQRCINVSSINDVLVRNILGIRYFLRINHTRKKNALLFNLVGTYPQAFIPVLTYELLFHSCKHLQNNYCILSCVILTLTKIYNSIALGLAKTLILE